MGKKKEVTISREAAMVLAAEVGEHTSGEVNDAKAELRQALEK